MPVSRLFIDPWRTQIRSWLLGTDGHAQHVTPTTNRDVLAQVMVASFRIPGLASANHNLFYIAALAGATCLVAVRRLTVQMDATAVFSTVAPSFDMYVTATLPTGGTDCAKHLFDSADSVNANVVARGAASADGTASAITWAGPVGTPGWRQMFMRLATTTSTGAQVLTRDELNLPIVVEDDPKILRAGQALIVKTNIAADANMHYTFNAMFEECLFP